MTKKEQLKRIDAALEKVNAEIADNSVGKYGRGLASEGYAGGVRDTLNDVKLLLSGIVPNSMRGYWRT